MRKFTTLIWALCATFILQAQSITEDSHWFDGSAYYTATELEGSILFAGDSADDTYHFEFRLRPLKSEGLFKLAQASDESIVPFRTDYGSLVKISGKGNSTTLSILDDEGAVSWTLVRTDKSHQDCLATEFWAKSQPLEKMVSSYVMNTHYLSVLSKTQLRYMQEILNNKPSRTAIEENNLQLIGSELKVGDFKRVNVGDLQTLAEANAPTIVTVTNEKEFIKSLRNGTTIHLPEGTRINLSEIISDDKVFKKAGGIFDNSIDPYIETDDRTLLSEPVHNGRQLTILNLRNVTILGDGDCHIVVDPAYAYVLNFVLCENIKLVNVTMGHTVEGYCTGGVVGTQNCKNITLEGCDLYGCGAYGIVADQTNGIVMNNSIIRDCSYGIMQLSRCQDAQFKSCNFYRNREYSLVTVDSGCRNILFDECRFYENRGLLFDLDSKIQMRSCGIVHNDPTELGQFNKYIEQLDNNTTIKIAKY